MHKFSVTVSVRKYSLPCSILVLIACKEDFTTKKTNIHHMQIFLQPFNDLDESTVEFVFNKIQPQCLIDNL